MEGQQTQPAAARNNVEVMAQYVMPGGIFNMLRNLEQVVRIMVGWSACTLEVFVRREFGERYLTLGRMIVGLMTIRFFLMLANLQSLLSWLPGINPPASMRSINRWYVACFILLSLLHLLRVWQRNNAGIPWHSHSYGVSWLDFLIALPPLRIWGLNLRVTDWVLYRFVEPGLCFLIALTLVPGPSFTRSWLIWASVAMLLHNNMVYNNRRTRFLDMVDSHIESGYYNTVRSETLDGPSPSRSVGYVTIPLPPIPLPAEADSGAGTDPMPHQQLTMESAWNSHEEA